MLGVRVSQTAPDNDDIAQLVRATVSKTVYTGSYPVIVTISRDVSDVHLKLLTDVEYEETYYDVGTEVNWSSNVIWFFANTVTPFD